MDMIAIPTIGRSDFAVPLYRTLNKLREQYHILIMVNSDDAEIRQSVTWQLQDSDLLGGCQIENTAGLNISEQWNFAMELASRRGAEILNIFNDDIVVSSEAVLAMSVAMASNPEYVISGYDYDPGKAAEVVRFTRFRTVVGTYRMGGIGGFAFAVRPAECPLVDPQFVWWGGDDDLVWQARQQGKRCGVAQGIPVRHPSPETSAFTRPELEQAKHEDHGRLLAKWGQAW